MIGLGLNATKNPTVKKTIVRDGLVLRHDYKDRPVEPVSSGAADINADGGNNEYIAINAKPIDTADGTYCWWSNSTQATYQTIFSHGGNSIGAFHAVMSTTHKPLLYLHPNRYQYWIDTGFADDGKWHHWAVVVDIDDMQNGCKLYIDGVLIAQDGGRIDSGTATSYGNMEIGKEGSSEYQGYLCNFGVWSVHLTQPQVKSIMHKDYAALSASEKTNLVSWWNLDSTVEDLGTAVYDNHGGGLGPELLANGGFSSDSDWTKGTGWTIANGVASHDASGGAGDLTQDLSLTPGKSYRITIEITATDTTELYFTTDSGDYVEVAGSPIGVHSHVFIADESTHSVGVRGSGNWDGSIDNVSVKLVNGNTGTLA